MLWHQLQPIAQDIFLNFQKLFAESIQHTSPDKNYFFEKMGEDIYFASQIPFPLMNGIISYAYDFTEIDAKCKLVKEKFKNANYPITWYWPHDMALPEEVERVFAKHGFNAMGSYTSVAVARDKIKGTTIEPVAGTQIHLVKNEKQFTDFLEITQKVYGVPQEAMASMTRFYSAYQFSNNIKPYVATVDEKPAAILLSYQFQKTLGLYNGATLEPYRKQGLLTTLVRHAIKEATHFDYVVAQLMAQQMAKGVCDQLGVKEYSHFIPLCYGFDLSDVHA